MLLILRLTGVLANQTGKNSRKTQTDPESGSAASPTCILAVRQPLPIITNWWACRMADAIAPALLAAVAFAATVIPAWGGGNSSGSDGRLARRIATCVAVLFISLYFGVAFPT